MSNIRGVKDRRFKFVQLLNSMFEDTDLSLKAKGFIGYCLTKPSDWHFSMTHLCSVLKEGERAIYAVINECIEHGYAYRYQTHAENGDFLPWQTVVSDSKHEIQEIRREIEKSLTLRGFGDAQTALAQNVTHSNTELSNTEKEVIIDDDEARAREEHSKEEKSVQGNVNYLDSKGNSQTITTSEIFRQLIGSPYPTEVIRQAIDRMRKIRSPITDFMHYLKSICDSIVLQNKKSVDPIKKKEKKEPEFKLNEWLFEWQEFEKMLKSGKVTLEFVTETMKNNGVFNEWTKWREELQDA